MNPDDRVNILLVDDRPENLLALEAVLEELGQNLVKAQSGAEALKQLLRQDFAVILLDVQMPGMDGFETADLIKQRERSRHTPIIFVTAISKSDTYVARGYSVGAVDYVFKPIVPEILRSKVVVFVDLFKKSEEVKRLNEVLQRRTLELEAANRQLEHDLTIRKQMEETTSRLIHEQAARAQAEAALRERDEFLSVAAHELKTPVAVIAGYTQLLGERIALEPEMPARNQKALRIMMAQVDRLTRLIDMLLDLGRVATGHFDLKMQLLDLNLLVRRVVAEVEMGLDQHTITVVSEVADEPLLIEGDEPRLEQVFLNLLQNALKYSPFGGPITVHLARLAAHGRVVVADCGIGIPPADLPHIFERFYRAANTEQVTTGGMGIGLYLVHQLVTRHGGTIEVASEEGNGSTFTVLLPLAAD